MAPKPKNHRRYRTIADKIIQRIGAGEYAAGDRLPSERDLVSELNVSRPTLREALIALEIMGYVAVRERSGIYVVDTDDLPEVDVDLGIGPFELLEARKIFEADIAGIAAENITNDQLMKIRHCIELQIKACEEEGEHFETVDRQFHTSIAEASGNGALVYMVDELWKFRRESDIQQTLDRHSGGDAMKSRAVDDHVKILAALETRDPSAAAKAMNLHIQNNIDWRLENALQVLPVSDADRRIQLRLRLDRERAKHRKSAP